VSRPIVDTIHNSKRETDKSSIARMGSFALRWQWVLWVATWLFLAVGFDFKKPSEKFQNLESRVSHVETRGDTMMSILRGLAIDACQRLHDNYYARRQLGCDERDNR
jgi:hypothetical protein